jgi:hypothetical protein
LRGILRVVLIDEYLAADAQNHRPVPVNQGRESSFIARLDKSIEQLAVALARRSPRLKQNLDLPGEFHRPFDG